MLLKTFFLATFLTLSLVALELQKPLPSVTLEGDNGAQVNGKPFHSDTLKGKVHIIFYVDPDEKDLNEELTQILKKEEFDKNKFGSVAIINLAATWKPNFVIEKILAAKQKEFVDTLYVKDKKRVLVKAWKIADDNSDIILLDKDGVVLYYHAGKVTNTQELIDLIKAHI